MDKEINWERFRSFLGVLEEGSLSAAARELGSTQPTIGRHIAALEKSLNTPLFIHAPHGLIPTPAALALQPHAASMAASAAALLRIANGQGDKIQGIVRVAASEIIGVEVLPPMLARLRDAHPGLIIELVVSNQIQDLFHREADIAVRMVRPHQNPFIARSAGEAVLGFFATRGYLEKYGTPTTFSELNGHSLIGFDQPTAFIRQISASVPELRREMFSLRTGNDLAQLALIRAGAGIGICQTGLTVNNPALVRLLSESFSLRLPAWITMHEDLRTNLPCRTVFDALASGIEAYNRSMMQTEKQG